MSRKTRQRQRQFCTVCGDDLENFCFSPDVDNLEALRTSALRCHLRGKAEGEVCAKVFIAGDSAATLILRQPKQKVSRAALSSLRDAIRKLIRTSTKRAAR